MIERIIEDIKEHLKPELEEVGQVYVDHLTQIELRLDEISEKLDKLLRQ